ncbi:MAG: GNAT family N-acetyltransferase [Muribaculum sp.]|nr:GNAT family N-acetyltransferase [Muribaculum sp.]
MIVTIAPARREDFETLMALYRAAVGEEGCTWDEGYPSEEDIRGDLDRDSLYCARDENGEIIAAFAVDQDEEVDNLSCWSPALVPSGEISRLVVRQDCRNQGIARQMLAFGMEELKRRGFRGIHFLVGTQNERALRSYAKFAFERAGEARLYGQDWYCYEKALGEEIRAAE